MFELRTVQPVASRFTKYIIPAAIYILVYMVRSSNIYIYIYTHTHTYIRIPRSHYHLYKSVKFSCCVPIHMLFSQCAWSSLRPIY